MPKHPRNPTTSVRIYPYNLAQVEKLRQKLGFRTAAATLDYVLATLLQPDGSFRHSADVEVMIQPQPQP